MNNLIDFNEISKIISDFAENFFNYKISYANFVKFDKKVKVLIFEKINDKFI